MAKSFRYNMAMVLRALFLGPMDYVRELISGIN